MRDETSSSPLISLFVGLLCCFNRGLKGTSKSVVYRCVWNENLVFCPSSSGRASPLTKENLQLMTYWMGFQYATTTKAPRLPAVLQYSMRLANLSIGFGDYLVERTPGRFALAPDEHDVYRKANGDARLMPAFNPFCGAGDIQGAGDEENFVHHDSIPFHPHVSA